MITGNTTGDAADGADGKMGFSDPFTPAAGPDGILPLSVCPADPETGLSPGSGEEICSAQMAAKLPATGTALARPKNPAIGLCPALALTLIADSMVEVTVRKEPARRFGKHECTSRANRRERKRKTKRQWNEENCSAADEKQKAPLLSGWAECAQARQILSMPCVGLPLQEQVVELALFAARRIAVVFAALLVPQALESLALAPGLSENSLLLVPQIFKP